MCPPRMPRPVTVGAPGRTRLPYRHREPACNKRISRPHVTRSIRKSRPRGRPWFSPVHRAHLPNPCTRNRLSSRIPYWSVLERGSVPEDVAGVAEDGIGWPFRSHVVRILSPKVVIKTPSAFSTWAPLSQRADSPEPSGDPRENSVVVSLRRLSPNLAGWLANSTLYFVVLCVLLLLPGRLRRARRRRASRCPRCAYPQGDGGVCSECGYGLSSP